MGVAALMTEGEREKRVEGENQRMIRRINVVDQTVHKSRREVHAEMGRRFGSVEGGGSRRRQRTS
jgi:hypothetical protein